jgi:hypothetical protein
MSMSHAEWTALHVLRYEVKQGRIEATPEQKTALDKRYKDLTVFIIDRAVVDAAFFDAQTELCDLKP